jgi:hypothetical protein
MHMDAIFIFAWNFLYYTWFLWLFMLLFPLTKDIWLSWRQKVFEHNIKWAMFELIVPREIKASPQAMEQIFLQLHSFKNYPGNPKEVWLDGEVTLWHSFEIAAYDGEVHFFVRTPKHLKHLLEAAFFGYYQDIEIVEAEDYMKRFPSTVQALYAKGYRMWGTELLLNKSAAYPIRSYTEFESPDEDKQYDPMSGFIEILSKLKPGQMEAIQILAGPAMIGNPHDEHAMHEYNAELQKAKDRKDDHGGGHGGSGFKFSLMPADEEAHEEEPKRPSMRTPGETDVLKAINENLARPMYSVMIRHVYVSPFDTYDEHFPRRAIMGAFNQYSALDVNGFRANWEVQTGGQVWKFPYIFPDQRREYRRQQIWHDFRHREMPPHHFMAKLFSSYPLFYPMGSETIHLSTRSLATLWHPPTYRVLTGPHMRRVESKKAGPPAGIEIFGEDKEIERYS